MPNTAPNRRDCREQGHLVAKSSCFALQRDDGREFWLELDPIPLHLVDSRVTIAGERFADLIRVDAIGPADGDQPLPRSAS